MSTRTEYRAIVRRPASILDSPELRLIGHVDEPSSYAESKSKIEKTNYDLRCSEETHAYVHKWQKRTLEVGEWEDEVFYA